MGKYIRKPKTTRDVSVMDVSQSSLGVRTRARTLALQRLQSSAVPPPDYLELRSRRLEKTPLLWKHLHNSRRNSATKQGFVFTDEEKPQTEGSPPKPGSESGLPIAAEKEEDEGSSPKPGSESGLPIAAEKEEDEAFEIGGSEIEASLGENYLDLEDRERSTRESTPCSLIRTADSISPPGSSTKRRNPTVSNRRTQNPIHRNIPTSREMEEFFACAEQPHQRLFMEKYNFDIVNDLPLPGRYEWVRVTP